jgi:hypothetical protein
MRSIMTLIIGPFNWYMILFINEAVVTRHECITTTKLKTTFSYVSMSSVRLTYVAHSVTFNSKPTKMSSLQTRQRSVAARAEV